MVNASPMMSVELFKNNLRALITSYITTTYPESGQAFDAKNRTSTRFGRQKVANPLVRLIGRCHCGIESGCPSPEIQDPDSRRQSHRRLWNRKGRLLSQPARQLAAQMAG